MCGPNSMQVVFGVTNGKAGVKVLFLLDEAGNIGTSHSAIRSAYKLSKDRKMVNVNFAEGVVSYEKGTPDWYGKFQAQTEKQIATIINKTIPAYQKALAVAQLRYDKAVLDTQVRAGKVLAAAKKAAFAKTGALPL